MHVHQILFKSKQDCYRNLQHVITCIWRGRNEHN